jgi:enterochelin esterase-like enzyme
MPQVEVGRLVRLGEWASRHVDTRPVDVWLPPGFVPGQRCSLLLMHDGQMLFDARTTWNRQAWNAHTAVHALMQAGVIGPTVVVGIWNNGPQRYAEYYPQKFLDFAPQAVRAEYEKRAANGRLQSDAYLRFIVEELKPTIDRRYATDSGPDATVVAGSSMGGLISLYALCEYPRVFGAAAALSTHWVGLPTAWGLETVRASVLPQAALAYLRQYLPSPGHHRLYSDRGTDALDSSYTAGHDGFEQLLRERGYTSAQARTAVFEGTGHNETDWSQRLAIPLQFVLGT